MVGSDSSFFREDSYEREEGIGPSSFFSLKLTGPLFGAGLEKRGGEGEKLIFLISRPLIFPA